LNAESPANPRRRRMEAKRSCDLQVSDKIYLYWYYRKIKITFPIILYIWRDGIDLIPTSVGVYTYLRPAIHRITYYIIVRRTFVTVSYDCKRSPYRLVIISDEVHYIIYYILYYIIRIYFLEKRNWVNILFANVYYMLPRSRADLCTRPIQPIGCRTHDL